MSNTRCQLNNPDLLTWARERAELTTAEMAAELGVNVINVVAWESGISLPTHGQVKAYARLGHTNVATLYLPERPPHRTVAEQLRDLATEAREEPEQVVAISADRLAYMAEQVEKEARP